MVIRWENAKAWLRVEMKSKIRRKEWNASERVSANALLDDDALIKGVRGRKELYTV